VSDERGPLGLLLEIRSHGFARGFRKAIPCRHIELHSADQGGDGVLVRLESQHGLSDEARTHALRLHTCNCHAALAAQDPVKSLFVPEISPSLGAERGDVIRSPRQ